MTNLTGRSLSAAVPIIASGMLSIVLAGPPALADEKGEIRGKPKVLEGDLLTIAGTTLRLHGIDAPELAQTCLTRKKKQQRCGSMARQALFYLVRHQVVTCKTVVAEVRGYPSAVCFIGPFSVNEQMVADGWALAERSQTEDYVRAETFAKARREGIWRTDFKMPWEWRAQNAGKSD